MADVCPIEEAEGAAKCGEAIMVDVSTTCSNFGVFGLDFGNVTFTSSSFSTFFVGDNLELDCGPDVVLEVASKDAAGGLDSLFALAKSMVMGTENK